MVLLGALTLALVVASMPVAGLGPEVMPSNNTCPSWLLPTPTAGTARIYFLAFLTFAFLNVFTAGLCVVGTLTALRSVTRSAHAKRQWQEERRYTEERYNPEMRYTEETRWKCGYLQLKERCNNDGCHPERCNTEVCSAERCYNFDTRWRCEQSQQERGSCDNLQRSFHCSLGCVQQNENTCSDPHTNFEEMPLGCEISGKQHDCYSTKVSKRTKIKLNPQSTEDNESVTTQCDGCVSGNNATGSCDRYRQLSESGCISCENMDQTPCGKSHGNLQQATFGGCMPGGQVETTSSHCYKMVCMVVVNQALWLPLLVSPYCLLGDCLFVCVSPL